MLYKTIITLFRKTIFTPLETLLCNFFAKRFFNHNRNWMFLTGFILISIFLAAIIFVAFFYFTLDDLDINRDLKFGVTFIPRHATELELNWQETYLAVFDDLDVRRLRLVAYWNIIEKEKGVYDFSELDWLVGEAEKRSAKIILAIGMRVPGWPECHIPDWAKESLFSDDPFVRLQSEQALLKYLRVIVDRYRDSSAIWAWQVENEPFLQFGECPISDKEFLSNEIKLVKTIDKRPIIITESGEFGNWRKAAPFGDILGTTLYRKIYYKRFGYINYHLSPSFYRLKSLLVKKWTRPDNIIVVELQSEPWVADPPINKASMEEQYITMNPEFFRDTLDYIRYTDFNEFYFWGAEWWYWMKQEGRPEIWDIAKGVFVE
ncbi:MAG: hypothetical protein US76_01125 [Parcubacteria group bacterium GW2011_GWA2_38_13b]|nr:MAG: hypothetical protein US76_01125 [Parcubacteria group bacterium GW2011_GWA2_38_13b]